LDDGGVHFGVGKGLVRDCGAERRGGEVLAVIVEQRFVLLFTAGLGEVERVAAEGFCAGQRESFDAEIIDNFLGGSEPTID
tara:strand:- start:2779 stop:3021 length:243 start_codon:yes stop_codon:yes gene_type:complete